MKKYVFIGKPDKKFPNLVTGKVYMLKVVEESKGPLGFLVGNTKPVIMSPIQCPYSSWEAFYRNWGEVWPIQRVR